MGNYLPGAGKILQRSNQPEVLLTYSDLSLPSVREAFATYRELYFNANMLDSSQFDEVFGAVFGDTQPHFEAWAGERHPDHVNALQVFSAIAVYCEGSLQERAILVFDVFDLDGSAVIDVDELVILLHSTIIAMCKMAGGVAALDAECIHGAQLLARSIIRSIDTDGNRTLSRSEFVEWAIKNVDVAIYVDGFTQHTEVRVAAVQMRISVMEAMEAFDAVNSRIDQTASIDHAVNLLSQLCPNMTGEENEICSKGMQNSNKRCDRSSFEAFARAVIQFNVVAKGTAGPIKREKVEALLWLQNGFQPSELRIRAELESLGDSDDKQNDRNWQLTRRHWLSTKCNGSLFDNALYAEFEKYDQDQSGKLSTSEIAEMLFETMTRDYIGSKVMGISESSKQIMRAMVNSLAQEIVESIDGDGDQHVTWPELRRMSAYIVEKREALARWYLDFHLSFLARYFAFDEDLNATLDELEIQSALLQRIRPLVINNTITIAESNALVRETTATIMEVSDRDKSGAISMTEFHDCAQRISSIEATMILKARNLPHTRTQDAIEYAKPLPKKKLAMVAMLRSTRVNQIAPKEERDENEPISKVSELAPEVVQVDLPEKDEGKSKSKPQLKGSGSGNKKKPRAR